MRTQTMRIATAVLLGVALLGTAACSSGQLGKQHGPAGAGAQDGEAEPAGSPGEDAEADPSPAAADGTTIPGTGPIQAPEKAVGTRAHPLPTGVEFLDGDWAVTLGQPHDGWDELRDADPYIEEPEDGTEYWLVPVTVTYTGEESASPWLDLQFGFVGEDNRSYRDWCPAHVPDDLMEVDELYPDGTAEANVCLPVPADADGLWSVSSHWGDPVFFTAEAGGDDD